MQPSEVYNLENETVNVLFSQIDQIEAMEQLAMIGVFSYPELKEEQRRKMFNNLKNRATPKFLNEEQRPLTTADLASILSKRK